MRLKWLLRHYLLSTLSKAAWRTRSTGVKHSFPSPSVTLTKVVEAQFVHQLVTPWEIQGGESICMQMCPGDWAQHHRHVAAFDFFPCCSLDWEQKEG